MSETQSIFERHEQKYLISANAYDCFIRRTREHLTTGEFGSGPVFSLYYDTPQRSVIAKSMEKPLYKEKLRLRSYGTVGQDGPVFIELKKKMKGVVYKRRVCCSYAAARVYMSGASFPAAVDRYPLNSAVLSQESSGFTAQQTVGELNMFKQRNPQLEPSMFIAVERKSYAALDRDDLRITFDINPTWRDTDLRLDGTAAGHRLMPEGTLIMEIKCSGAYPLWLVRTLNSIQAAPQSCSKYGRAYTQQKSRRGLSVATIPIPSGAEASRPHIAQRDTYLQPPIAAIPASALESKEVPCV